MKIIKLLLPTFIFINFCISSENNTSLKSDNNLKERNYFCLESLFSTLELPSYGIHLSIERQLEVSQNIIERLNNKLTDINYFPPRHLPLLLCSAKRGLYNVTKLLLDFGANVNIKDGLGNNAFFYAERPEIQDLLLKRGTDINSINKDYETAIQALAPQINFKEEPIKMLLELGANIHTVYGSDVTLLIWCVKNYIGNSFLKLILDYGVDLNSTDSEGRTALMWSVIGHHPERHQVWAYDAYDLEDTIILLLDYGANINKRDKNNKTVFDFIHTDRIKKIFQIYENGYLPYKKNKIQEIQHTLQESAHITPDLFNLIVQYSAEQFLGFSDFLKQRMIAEPIQKDTTDQGCNCVVQ